MEQSAKVSMLEREVELLREKVRLLERLHELEADAPYRTPYRMPYYKDGTGDWQPPYIITCDGDHT